MDPCWFHVCSYDVIFKLVLQLWHHKKRHHHQKTIFVLKLAKLVWNFFIIYIGPKLQSNFCNQKHLEHFKKIFCITKVFGLRVGGVKILTMISVQKYQFSAKSESRTTVYACCPSKLCINNKCLIYINSLDFPLNIHITKIVQFRIP